MFKIHNNTATKEEIPSFLVGLSNDSLSDLSWTDPSLGVSEFAWYIERDDSPAITLFQKYDGESLFIDHEQKVVRIVRNVVDLTNEEIEEKRKVFLTNVENEIELRINLVNKYLETEEIKSYKEQVLSVITQPNYPFEITWPSQPTLLIWSLK